MKKFSNKKRNYNKIPKSLDKVSTADIKFDEKGFLLKIYED